MFLKKKACIVSETLSPCTPTLECHTTTRFTLTQRETFKSFIKWDNIPPFGAMINISVAFHTYIGVMI